MAGSLWRPEKKVILSSFTYFGLIAGRRNGTFTMADPKIHFTASPKPEARQALETMTRRYGQTAAGKAESK